MKSRLIAILWGMLIFGAFGADEKDFDKALEGLLKDAVTAVAGSKKQKVAVLEFADLNGKPTTFGKFLAEEVSVGLVLAKETFTVVDRANLKSILEEHKLTEEGLIQPENAKKLGEFSGVDALVLGTATSTPSGYIVTLKVISTDKAEICGAARGRLPKSPDFDAVVQEKQPVGDMPLQPKANPNGAGEAVKPKGFTNSYLRAEPGKIQFLKSGEVSVSFKLFRADESGKKEVIARIDGGPPRYRNYDETFAEKAPSTSLVCSDGTEFALTNIAGLTFPQEEGSDFPTLTETTPLVATYRFKPTAGKFAGIPKNESLTLSAPVRVWTRTDKRDQYNEVGITTIHLDGLR